MASSRCFALIPAAGVGARLGAGFPKQYLPVAGRPMLLHAAHAFAASPLVEHVFIVVSAGDAYIGEVMAAAQDWADKVTVLPCGGATRRDSVLNGLRAIADRAAEDDWVLVHDAARPGLTGELIRRLIDEAGADPVGGLLALPVVDTLKRADAARRVDATVPRDGLWAAQTPQMFRHRMLVDALDATPAATDEASAIEARGLRPRLVEGHPRNFKVTLPHDVALAELFLKAEP